jgi:hypothetical protein
MPKTNPAMGREYEKTIAHMVNGRMVPASGSGKYDKGDVESKSFLIDCKWTGRDQYILKRATFETIEKHALERQKCPAIIVGFGPRNIAIVDFERFLELDMTDVASEASLKVAGLFGQVEMMHIKNPGHDWISLTTVDHAGQFVRLDVEPGKFRELIVYLNANKGYFGL